MIFRLKYTLGLLLFVIMAALSVSAGTSDDKGYFVRGIVRDSISDEALPGVFVSIAGSNRGTVTDKDGIFELTVPSSPSTLIFHSQGYGDKSLPILRNRVNVYAVHLTPVANELEAVVIRRKRYSKRNNPAVDLMRHIRKTADNNDPTRSPYYRFDSYRRMTFGLNDVDVDGRNRSLLARFPFLAEHLDTSEVSGKTILPLSIREQTSTVYHRQSPKSSHTEITGKRNDGIDEILDDESMTRFMNDVMADVDIYARDINILQNRFVSPLSPISADFYKFYITDSLVNDGRKYYTLSFYPHNKTSFGFVGQLLVAPTDTSAFVKSVSMRVDPDINLNFIDNLVIFQEFNEAPDGSRLKIRDEMTMEVSLIPGTQSLYARRIVDSRNHSFDAPVDEERIFRPRAPVTEFAEATKRDSTFWIDVRPITMPDTETHIARMMERLRSNRVYYWGEKILRILVTGYIPTNRNTDRSLFDFGPMNTTISANPLEGARLRAGGMTTAALNRRLFARVYGAWGFRDHRWKYGVELEYSFIDKQRHSYEFPVRSLRFNSSYDVDRPGQDYVLTNPDNVFLSLHRPGVDPMTYRRYNALSYIYESDTHFSVTATVANERQTPSRLMPFALPDGTQLDRIDESWITLALRYAPGETFYQTASNRFPINLDAPVIQLSHTYAPNGLGSRAAMNITKLSFSKRFWFSAFGYLDVLLKGGHIWSRNTPFNHLFVANTNLSYTIQPESFALTAPMEFVADSYGTFDVTYWANGLILNRIPLIKKLRLREAFSARGFWGRLSYRNNPVENPEMIVWPGWQTTAERLKTPYFEASVGIDNILRCLRVDYVWRLNHRNTPVSGASNHGVRIAFHVTF